MNLDKFLVVSGIPGVHKLVTSRADGVIIEDRKEGRTRFVSSRQGQVTPLASVAVYTNNDEGDGTIPLVEVFEKMYDQVEAIPPADLSATSQEFRDYFTKILPDHDQDRVHINDIKKCIKWFNFMHQNGILEEAKKEAAEEKAAEATAEAEGKTVKKAAASSKKSGADIKPTVSKKAPTGKSVAPKKAPMGTKKSG